MYEYRTRRAIDLSARRMSETLSCINNIIQLSMILGYECTFYQDYRDYLFCEYSDSVFF